MQRIAFLNKAGGVGKTTAATHVAHSLAIRGASVLLVDCDPQCNATAFLGVADTEDADLRTLYHAFIDTPQWVAPICKTQIDRLMVLPGGAELAAIDVLLAGYNTTIEAFLEGFASMIEAITSDFVIFDCPPSEALMTHAALALTDGVICPVTPEPKAVMGTQALLSSLTEIGDRLGREIKVLGFVPSRYDRHSSVHRQCLDAMRLQLLPFGRVFNPVRDSYKILSAQARGKTLYQTNPGDSNCLVFDAIAASLLRGGTHGA